MKLGPPGSHLAPDLLALRPGVPEFFGLDLDRFDGRSTRSFLVRSLSFATRAGLLGAKKPSRREKETVPEQKRNRMRLEHRESCAGEQLQTTLRGSAAYVGSSPASY
jgi:hypothetical protein